MPVFHTYKWATIFESVLDNQGNDIALGSDGSIYITGKTRGDLNLESIRNLFQRF